MLGLKKTFLLSHAIRVEMKEPKGVYSPELQLNMVSPTDQTPLVSLQGAPPTHSKTAARPGDDDPDPGNDSCY